MKDTGEPVALVLVNDNNYEYEDQSNCDLNISIEDW